MNIKKLMFNKKNNVSGFYRKGAVVYNKDGAAVEENSIEFTIYSIIVQPRKPVGIVRFNTLSGFKKKDIPKKARKEVAGIMLEQLNYSVFRTKEHIIYVNSYPKLRWGQKSNGKKYIEAYDINNGQSMILER